MRTVCSRAAARLFERGIMLDPVQRVEMHKDAGNVEERPPDMCACPIVVKGFENAVSRMPSPTLNYNEFSQFTNSVDKSVAISEL